MSERIFCLMGPTASGKTALVFELVKQFPFEVISVDSALIYRGMDIGTAKPSIEELRDVPHHLIDILDPPEIYSAAQFCEDVLQLCAKIFKKGKIPLLAGGTMMYFHALQQGLSTLPEANETIRQQLLEEARAFGWAALHERLSTIDGVTAVKIHPNDTQRIQRALEVFYITGKPLSDFLSEGKTALSYDITNLVLFPEDRAWLHRQIALRFEKMLHAGFVDEAAALIAKWQLSPSCPAMRCVGYRQAWEYLQNELSYDEFCSKSIAATRQLAKRQLTWLRHWPEGHFFPSENKAAQDNLIAIIAKILDNDGH